MNYSNSEIKWNQWFAGVIDGDGYLAIQKNNVAVCEITMPLCDEPLLAEIKQRLGGSIRLRSGAQAVRYRLGHKAGIQELIERVNGSIRNSVRVPQFQRLCEKFEIPFIPAPPLDSQSGYTAGFYDADGTTFIATTRSSPEHATQKGDLGKINRLSHSRGANQLRVGISNKHRSNVEIFYEAFGFGQIRELRQLSKTCYTWELRSEEDILRFIDYATQTPCRSDKRKRLFLALHYFKLKRMKAHLAPEGTNKLKAWFLFSQKWYS
uniref:Putative site-specific DNA endonuclease n=1 Tax=Oltmannsiellopsis viridis TaxID=51324 RepID=Q20ET4_OLTVI|nr:putative site-specific DNA endonuclease [Oltmannsiellopsis viridis]YP_635911.1 putative site-specific DNA endonuclease [Oltmannsiellopsis viridis]ABB81979.1 putative site-specific DNA endonuclease [Oltmannsiellopsis viridis]ABB82013.1 putative site-specific DNA endonuclease [Oltmannsiellopsis viridis]